MTWLTNPYRFGVDLRAQVISALFGAGQQGVFLDPSDLSTLWQDSAGTTPVTADNDPVGRIVDLSGNGNHFTQSTAGKRPLYKTDGTLHWLQFDGAAAAMATGLVDFSAADTLSISAACTKVDSTARIIAELTVTTTSNNGSAYLVPGNNIATDGFTSLGKGTVGGTDAVAKKTVIAGTYVITTSHDISADLSTMRVNGVAGTDGAGDKGTGNFANSNIYLGARAATSVYYNGKLYGFAMSQAFAGASTEQWLAEKSGVTL